MKCKSVQWSLIWSFPSKFAKLLMPLLAGQSYTFDINVWVEWGKNLIQNLHCIHFIVNQAVRSTDKKRSSNKCYNDSRWLKKPDCFSLLIKSLFDLHSIERNKPRFRIPLLFPQMVKFLFLGQKVRTGISCCGFHCMESVSLFINLNTISKHLIHSSLTPFVCLFWNT